MLDRQITALADSDGRVNIYEGAIRSGKTFSSLIRWLTFVATAPRGGELVIIGKNKDSIYRNIFAPFETNPALGLFSAQVKYRQGAASSIILGRKVHVIGANDAKAESKIRGMTVAGAYVDEVTVLPFDFFKQLLGRMSVDGAQLFGTTNPDSPNHWLKTNYLDKIEHPDDKVRLTDWRRFKFTIDDNPSLNPAYVASLKREFTGLSYRRFIDGDWVSAQGAISDIWDVSPFNRENPRDGGHVIGWADLPEMEQLYAVGIDYGTTNPTSAIILGLGVDRRLYLIDEWRHDSKEGELRLTDAELSKRLRDWLRQEHLPNQPGMRPQYTILDPSAASFRVQLNHDGIGNITPAENDVQYGIKTVSSLLSQKLLVVSDKCHGFLNEVAGYSWDEDAQKKGEDKPVKVADHSMDSARYVIATTETLWKHALDYSLAA